MKDFQSATRWAALCAMLAIGPAAVAQPTGAAPPVYVFPANGQDPGQQRQDRNECHGWAAEQSGYDPSLVALSIHMNSAAIASASSNANDTGRGSTVRSAAGGAAGGAAIGAVVGAISDDKTAGEGAAIGAGAGAVGGALRGRRQRREDEATSTAQADSIAEQTRLSFSNYGRAYKTCLEGRGYTIS